MGLLRRYFGAHQWPARSISHNRIGRASGFYPPPVPLALSVCPLTYPPPVPLALSVCPLAPLRALACPAGAM